jgi:hypothetical protein
VAASGAVEADSSVAAPVGIGESRWPPAVAVVIFMSLNIALRAWLPIQSPLRVPFLVPAIEAVLLIVLLAHPAREDPRRGWVRPAAVAVVVTLVLAALWETTLLVHDLIAGHGIANKPAELLATGAVVWIGNNLAFGLLYWLMDGGGPIARLREPLPVDFAFTQQMSPELVPAWRPVFLDYLHLGFTNATAFSPTDVMPLTLRAKYAMVVQASVALALFGLIVARSVNAFT